MKNLKDNCKSKTLRFFNKSDGSEAPSHDYFVMKNGTVWRDNYRSCESQASVVSFDDFVVECPEVGWEVV